MYSVTVRDHVLVAHSLPDPAFGPAQRLHGATYVVDVTIRAADLDEHGIIVDLGAAAEALHQVLAPLGYRNLDDLPELAGVLTTTEALARHVADRVADLAAEGALGRETSDLDGLTVTLQESPVAWASYERGL